MPYQNKRYFPVNWTDGMKVSSQDFIALEHSINQRLQDHCQLFTGSNQYGLLPGENTELAEYPKFELKYNQDNLLLILRECRGITPGGHFVDISERSFEERQVPGALPAQEVAIGQDGIFHIYIAVFPAELLPAGPFAQEGPPRQEYLSPRYQLYIFPHQEGTAVGISPNQLKIGELKVHNGIGELNKQFVPMCFSMSAHPRLRQIHRDFHEKLYQNAFEAIKKTLVHTKKIGSGSTYAEDVREVAQQLMQFLSGRHGQYLYVLSQSSPIAFIAFFLDLASSLMSAYDCLAHGQDINTKYPEKCKRDYGDVTIFDEAAQLIANAAKASAMKADHSGFLSQGVSDKLSAIELFIDKLHNYFDEMRLYSFTTARKRGGGVFGRG